MIIGDRMSLQKRMEEIIEKANERIEADPKLREEIAHLEKTFSLDLGTEVYSVKVKDSKIYDFEPVLTEDADVLVTSKPEHIEALMDGELRPMRAYITKKIQFKGKISDLLFLKKFM